MTICGACGYPNDEHEHRCEQCGRKFEPLADELDAGGLDEPDGRRAAAAAHDGRAPARAAVAVSTGPPVPSLGEQLRREASSRVQQFRERRMAQATLPLDYGEAAPTAPPVVTAKQPAPPPTPVDLTLKVIPFEKIAAARGLVIPPAAPPEPRPVPAPKPPLAVPPALSPKPSRRPQMAFSFPEPPAYVPQDVVEFPVAPLEARLLAASADAVLLAAAYGLFFGAYTYIGGTFPLHKLALTALGLSVLLVAATFFFVSLYLGSATPGMRWIGLRVVGFDGRPANRGQRSLRLLGLLASSAALGFGFLWAFVDEERLTWHDRISRTCLTF